MDMSDETNPFADFPIISSYTVDDAIADGVFIHFEAISPGKWCVTQGVWAAIQEGVRGSSRTPEQALHNMMSDALGFVQANKAKVSKKIHEVDYLFDRDFAEWMAGNITNRDLWMSYNETGGFTVMFPEER